MDFTLLTIMEIDDWGFFLFHEFISLIVWLFVGLVIGGVAVGAVKGKVAAFSWRATMSIVAISLVVWFFYFMATARTKLVMELLDSENDDVAEAAYQRTFSVDLGKSLSLAGDSNCEGNVRFYAACRAADLLVTNKNSSEVDAILASISYAPPIKTAFFNTNSITYGFFRPGYLEGLFYVNDIIAKRMARLRLSSTNAESLKGP